MSLAVINGSPRGKQSNSNTIIKWFLNGYNNPSLNDKEIYDTHYLNKVAAHNDAIETIDSADKVLFVFPLYVDGMPGQVKTFFELMSSSGYQYNKKEIVFVIHSGFPEGIHSKALEQYLMSFGHLLGFNSTNVIILPGSEGFRFMPDKMTQKKQISLGILAEDFAIGRVLNKETIKTLQKPISFNKPTLLLLTIFNELGIFDLHWKNQLKGNNAYENRYAAPYLNKTVPITTKAHIKNY